MARDNEDTGDSPAVEPSYVRPNNPWPIDPYVESGIDLARHLNELVSAVDSTNFVGDAGRPSYSVAGTLWCKQDANGKFSLYLFNGSGDLLIGDSDGIGTDQINMSELIVYLEQNMDVGVESFTGADGNNRSGAVIAEDGDYKITMMGDYGSPDGTYTNKYAIVGDGSKFVISPVVNSFTGIQGDTRAGDVQAKEGDYDLTSLGDVALNNLTKDDMLQFNGTSWENNPPKLIDTELTFAGPIDPNVPAPAAEHAWLYIANQSGNAHSSFTGIAGSYVQVGNALGYSTNHNANGDKVPDGTGGAWFLLGDVFSAAVTSIGQGAGILVDSSTPSTPVISVNRQTVDNWYADINHLHTGVYAEYNHNHDGEYAGINHLHTGVYEPVISPKRTAFNKNFGTTSGTVAEGNHGHSGYAVSGHSHSEYALKTHTHTEYEPKFSKNSAFNKNFGSGYNDVARGDHTHGDGTVGPHTHTLAEIGGGVGVNNGKHFIFPTEVTAQSSLNVSGGYLNVVNYISCDNHIYAGTTLRAGGDVIAYYGSDERMKDNIRSIDSVLDKVCQIRSIEFEWNDNQDDYEGTDVGVSAQSVQAVFPSLVKEREKDGFLGVRYEKLVGPAIGAIAELRDMVTALQSEVAELKAKLGESS